MDYFTPLDLLKRILRKKSYWFHGPPTYQIIGEDKTIGKLVFNFGDEVITIGVYLYDKRKVEDIVALTMANADKFVEEILAQQSDRYDDHRVTV